MNDPHTRRTRRGRWGVLGLILGIGALLILLLLILGIEPLDGGAAELDRSAEGDRAGEARQSGSDDSTVREDAPGDVTARGEIEPTYTIAGRLLDARTREPIAGCEVVALDEHPGLDGVWQRVAAFGLRDLSTEGDRGESHGSCTSGADGAFEISGLPSRRYFLDVYDPYLYAQPVSTVRLGRDGPEARGIELLAEVGGRIRGRVLDLDQSPVAGAQVSAYAGFANFLGRMKAGRYRWRDATSDEQGYFEIAGYPPGGGIVLSGSHPQFSLSHADNVVVAARTDADAVLYMKRGGRLVGRVLDAEGLPLEGAEISVLATRIHDLIFGGEIARSHRALTDAEGRFTLAHVPPGFVEVTAEHSSYLRQVRRGIRLSEGGAVEGLEFRLASGISVAGVVRGPQGELVSGATVRYRGFDFDSFTITRAGEMMRGLTAKTDAAGRFRLENLPAKDSYRLRASASGYGSGNIAGVTPGAEGVEIELRPTGAICGRVVDAKTGEPLRRFHVSVSGRRGSRRPFGGSGGGRGFPGGGGLLGRGGDGSAMPFGPPPAAMGRRGGRAFDSSDGSFVYEDVEPGSRRVQVSAEGFCPAASQTVEVIAGETAPELHFALGVGGSVSGVLISKLDGQAVVGARIHVGKRDNPLAALVSSLGMGGFAGMESDAEGRFLVEHLPPGQHLLSVVHSDFAKHKRGEIEVIEGQQTELGEVELDRGATLHGRVSDPRGRPARQCTVLVGTIAGMDFGQAMPDAEGNYEIERLMPGSYIVLVTRADEDMNPLSLIGNLRFDSVSLKAGERKRLDLVDESAMGCRVRGVVLDAGQPASGVMVIAMADGGSGPLGIRMKMSPSDQDGAFEFPSLPPGRYFMQLRRGPGGGTRIEVDVPEAEEHFVTLEMPDATVRGQVLDAVSSAGIGGVRVRLASVGGRDGGGGLLGQLFESRVAEARTDEQGRFEFRRVSPGSYKVVGRMRRSSPEDLGFGEGESESFSVAASEDVEAVLRLEAAGGLEGRVVDAQGAPVRGASIYLDRDGRRMDISDIATRGDGRFFTGGVRPGVYSVTVEAHGFLATQLPDQVVQAGAVIALDVRLNRGALLEVVVVDGAGKPVSGARVILQDEQGKPLKRRLNLRTLFSSRVLTSSEGRLDLGSHPPGAYRVVAKRRGGSSEPVAVTLRDGGRETAQVILR